MDYFDDERKKDFLDSDRNIAEKIKELSKELEQLKTVLRK